MNPHDAKVWRVDDSALWRWHCSCGRGGVSTAEHGAYLAAEIHHHRGKGQ